MLSARHRAVLSLYPEACHLVEAAERLLEKNDWIWCVWLFGSRVRCEARADSDWDVALITASYLNGERLSYRLTDAVQCKAVSARIECHQVPIDVFMRHRLGRGHVACAIASEGIPLATRQWHLPTHHPFEVFHMDNDIYNGYLRRLWMGVVESREIYSRLGDLSLRSEWQLAYYRLLRSSQTMAEGLSKAGCLIREIPPERLKNHGQDDLSGAPPVTLRDAQTAMDRLLNTCASMPTELAAHFEIHRQNSDQSAIAILERVTRDIIEATTRLQRVVRRSNPPRIAHDDVDQPVRDFCQYMWSRKPDVVESVDTLERGLEALGKDLDLAL